MICVKCGSEMWDNTKNKKNPKAPDYKCKNKECLDEKGYVTAVWLESFEDKHKPQELKAPPKVMPKPEVKNGNANIDAMLLSYAKDIVLALIEKDIIVDDITGKINEIYKEFKLII